MSNKILSLFFRGQADKAIHYFLTLSFALALSLYIPILFASLVAFGLISLKELADDEISMMDIYYNLFGAITAILINIPLILFSL